MKAINISELKSHLSKYLRQVRRGERIAVLDRREVVAELRPPEATPTSVWGSLEQEGRASLGTQDWASLDIKPLKKRVPIQKILREVREDDR